MSWSASVVSATSADTEPSVLINFDTAKYIFNAGECTSRAFMQNRLGWQKTKGIFLTSVGTERGSGLFGFMLFLADGAVKKLDIVGPPGIMHMLASARSYIKRSSMAVRPTEIDPTVLPPEAPNPSPVYSDDNIKVYAIPLLPFQYVDWSEDSYFLWPGDPFYKPKKRKRSESPDQLPNKRLQTDDGRIILPYNFRAPEDPTPFDEYFAKRIEDTRLSYHSPFLYRLSHAKEWRRLWFENTFPKQYQVEEPPSVEKRDKRKQREPQRKKDRGKKKQKVVKASAPPTSIPPIPTSSASIPPTPYPENEGEEDPEAMLDDEEGLDGDITSSPRRRSPHKHPEIAPFRLRRLPKLIGPSGHLPSKQSVCYIVEGPRYRGKFDPKKADALGVLGRDRRDLVNGIPVTVVVEDEQGNKVERVVQPSDCIAPSEPPHYVMIFDVPTPDHIPPLVSAFADSPFYSRLRSKREEDRKENLLHSIFHLCGNDVLEDPRYKEFMGGFSDQIHHIVSSRKHSPDPVSFTSAAFTQLRLNQLDKDMFPIPTHNLTPEVELSSVPDLPTNTHLWRTGLEFAVRPPKPPSIHEYTIERDVFHPAVISPEPVPLPPATTRAFAQAKDAASALVDTPSPGDEVLILPLGTSSAVPTKYRNVSSMYIQTPQGAGILLDCGEGTWGQLARFFGSDPSRSSGVWETLRNLKCIFLSHMHADHHMGVAKVLAKRQQLNPPPTEPIYVIGLRGHILSLFEQSDLEDLGMYSENGVVPVLSDRAGDLGDFYRENATADKEVWMTQEYAQEQHQRCCEALGLERLLTVAVRHKTKCYGLSLQHKDGWSILFSADTRPCAGLKTFPVPPTLLIHEATMGSDEFLMAVKKNHSTIAEAVDVGKIVRAKNILLTHFSARYPKMPPSDVGGTYRKDLVDVPVPTIGLAFDHAQFKIKDMPKLNAYLNAIQTSIEDTAEAGDEDMDPSKEVS